jgi:hypothetical protein
MREDVMQNESETHAQMSHPLKEATGSEWKQFDQLHRDKMLMRMREVVMLMRKMPNNMQLR